jgi:uncharacterized protein YwqG
VLWFKSKEKAALDAAIRAAAKPSTSLIVDRQMPADFVFPPTSTHFGGNPYFESGDSRPICEKNGSPYDFVCQVNLHDCPIRPEVPFDLLTIFLSWSLVAEGNPEGKEPECIVRTYRSAQPEKSVTINHPPSRCANDYQVRPCSIRTETRLTYPHSFKEHPEIIVAARNFRNPVAAFVKADKRVDCRDRFHSRMGGYPSWVHDATFEDDDFLGQIDYEPKANNCIGDAAPIFLAVSRNDPMKVDTDVWQSF